MLPQQPAYYSYSQRRVAWSLRSLLRRWVFVEFDAPVYVEGGAELVQRDRRFLDSFQRRL